MPKCCSFSQNKVPFCHHQNNITLWLWRTISVKFENTLNMLVSIWLANTVLNSETQMTTKYSEITAKKEIQNIFLKTPRKKYRSIFRLSLSCWKLKFSGQPPPNWPYKIPYKWWLIKIIKINKYIKVTTITNNTLDRSQKGKHLRSAYLKAFSMFFLFVAAQQFAPSS